MAARKPSNLDALSLPLEDGDIFIVQRGADASKVAYADLKTNELTGTAGETISAHKVLVMVGGELFHADPTNANHIGLYVGISTTSNTAGEPVKFIQSGELTAGSFTEGERYYVGLDGALSTTPVAVSATWRKFLGVAKSATVFVITPGPSIKTA